MGCGEGIRELFDYLSVLRSTDSGPVEFYSGFANFLRYQPRTRNAIDCLESSAWLIKLAHFALKASLLKGTLCKDYIRYN